ncbi:MAG: hypothetical protein B7X65_09665 [Polaromonas sp. 39-63-25]|nr:MAG: hypothetical protein B7Y60_12930 [Polaromonas sp. 35-63-35]OYZ19655.1 MAG: hypothetical protein B7Y28_10210 [Polaromonas sp. 16-63-31]OYZ80078.1 MAG: hypothetical protein B7Y09_06955 [Polaromonas sp. 24-63-21]OZA52196.1 MAG: hypothetical protein B7X88_05785 [Polaromonas sp. 17-63-33]OZA87773.1 MAG: hypothetical protein B7X65_09665 [Polaromonas sp. 39-63-25]
MGIAQVADVLAYQGAKVLIVNVDSHIQQPHQVLAVDPATASVICVTHIESGPFVHDVKRSRIAR